MFAQYFLIALIESEPLDGIANIALLNGVKMSGQARPTIQKVAGGRGSFSETMSPGATTAMTVRSVPRAQYERSTISYTHTHTTHAVDGVLRYREVASSQALQILLYYNAVYSFLFIVLNMLILRYKLQKFSMMEKILPATMFSIWVVIEMLRLFLGYKGNLEEKVQHLGAFFCISAFLQTAFVGYIAQFQEPLWPIDRICGCILSVFLFVELIFGYRAVKHVIRIRTSRFRLDFGTHDDMKDDEAKFPNVQLRSNSEYKSDSITKKLLT